MPVVPQMPAGVRLAAMVAFCLVAILAVGAGAPARAFSALAEGENIDLSGPRADRPHALYGDRLPAYVPGLIAMLKRNRAPAYIAEVVLVLIGESDQKYLLVQWFKDSDYPMDRVEFHKITELGDGRVRLTFLRQIQNFWVDVREPTGKTTFPDEATVAVIYQGEGGSGSEMYWVDVIQMKRNTVDIVPAGAGKPVDLADLDGDGRYELVTMDKRWADFFWTCSACGPHVPIIFRRVKGRFVPACREFAWVYHDRIRAITAQEERYAGPNGRPLLEYLHKSLGAIALMYAQIGETAVAETYRAALIAKMIRDGDEHGPSIAYTERTLGRAIDAAKRRHADAQCPLEATSPDGVTAAMR